MPYIRQPISFSTTEWPLAPSSAATFFNNRSVKQNTGSLLLFIASQMKEARQPFHSRVVFTLLNITAPIAGTSYGYQDSPSTSLYKKYPLTFTFALTKNKLYPGEEPKYVRTVNEYTRIWGNRAFTKNEFLTIRVDQSALTGMGITDLTLSNLRYLYQTVGMFSKNLVRRPDWLINNTFEVNGDWALWFQARQPIPDMVKEKPFELWCYNPNVWKRASNLIVEAHITPNLMLYWIMFLNIVPAYGDALGMFGPQGHLVKFVSKGLTELVSSVVSDTTMSINGYGAAVLYARAAGVHIQLEHVDAAAYEFTEAMSAKTADDAVRQAFISFHQDRVGLARDLLYGNTNKFKELPWV